ncbi:MAG: thioredoxin domain-containing protein [Myxococcales bacterium]|nr:thioredoxin domain-containing protein [Myxococcales bacterium]
MRSLCSLILVALAAVVAASPAAAGPGFDPDAIYAVTLDDAPRRGPADAPVTIVEFSDFACGYCNRAQGVLRHLERQYPGQIRWVFRTLPLDEDTGTLASEAALAAARQGRFWPMHDRLFAVHGRVDRAAVELIAVDLGLDLARFRDELDSGRARAAVLADLAVGRGLGITGTPAFFINGRAIAGAAPLSTFLRVVGEELVRSRDLGGAGDRYAQLTAGGRTVADSGAPPPQAAVLSEQDSYRIGLGLPGHRRGPDDAAVTIVVWSDFLCPYCANQAPILDGLVAAHPRDVRLVYRHLPLIMHVGAELAAEAAVEAGRQGKFWAFHDQLFAASKGGLPRDVLLERGKLAGLDVAALAAALADHRHRDVVAADAAAALSLGANGTPTLFVNGRALPGMVDRDELESVIAVELERARSLVARGVAAGDVYGVIGLGADHVEHGDPRQLARTGLRIEPGTVERARMVIAACRARDRDDARALAARLRGPEAALAQGVCADRGIDLP